jgi:plasmid stability protein
MTQLTIRNLDEAVIARLKQRAAAAGHSMEQEVRLILEREVGAEVEAFLERARRLRGTFGDRVFTDTVEIIRAMREERDRER